MNSVHLFVRDATGVQYLDTFTANKSDHIEQFRKHVAWWKHYVQTAEGLKAYQKTTKGLPCFPLEIVVEPYDDKTAP